MALVPAGMRAHMWTQVSVPALLIQILINAVLLALVMVATIFISKWLDFSWPDRIKEDAAAILASRTPD